MVAVPLVLVWLAFIDADYCCARLGPSTMYILLQPAMQAIAAGSTEGCLRLAVLREKPLGREHCRTETIEMINLVNAMPLDLPFVIRDHKSSPHRLRSKVTTYRITLDGHGSLP